jgi:hypothetical protein
MPSRAFGVLVKQASSAIAALQTSQALQKQHA